MGEGGRGIPQNGCACSACVLGRHHEGSSGVRNCVQEHASLRVSPSLASCVLKLGSYGRARGVNKKVRTLGSRFNQHLACIF